MKWIKKGFIFNATGQYEWMQSHVCPAAAIVLEDRIRIFISTRSQLDDLKNYISYISFLDVSKNNPSQVLYLHDKPLLELGLPGTFDEFGTLLAKPIKYKSKIYLYYMGWQRLASKKTPYQIMLGLAISDNNGFSFTKVSSGPIIGLDIYDPVSIGNVYVIQDNDLWKMWYTSLTGWASGGEKPTPLYNIKYAYSKDGISWIKTNEVVIDSDEKGVVATPTIFKHNNIYHMLFGYRPPYDENKKVAGYKIGYASSLDLKKWIRDDAKCGISASEKGWDSEMVCYPHVVEVDGNLIMFYCGNGFGKSGFGYAELFNSR